MMRRQQCRSESRASSRGGTANRHARTQHFPDVARAVRLRSIRTDVHGANIELSLDELDVLRNGLNEARLLLSAADFETRMGSPKDDVDALIGALKTIISRVADLQDAEAKLQSA